jgi:hypothetical protein
MLPASSLTTGLFVVLVFLMAGLVAAALRRAFPDWAWLGISVFALVWLVIPAALAAAGRLERYDLTPAPALAMVLVITLITIGVALSVKGAYLMHAVPLSLLVGMQSFRIGVEWLLHRLYLEGVVPVQMTWSGRNFDVVTGITALLLGVWLSRGRAVPGWVVLAWNLLGLALLVNIVAVAILSTPVPFRQFADGPANLLPGTFPFVWLPTFLVQLALIGHLLVFRKLARAAAVSGE